MNDPKAIEELRAANDALAHELEEEKVAHPLELFFDLVFVFAFTRVVSFVVHHLDLTGLLEAALLLALLWWGWGVWTWTLNAVDITPRLLRVAVLTSMLGIFIMGFAVPEAFDEGAWWFAGGYIWVRLVASVVMLMGTRDDAVEQAAVRSYLPMSFLAPLLIIAGAAAGGSALRWLWFGAAAIEVVAAMFAGRSQWRIDAGHFAERHGLIIIIALGEAIIAVGVALGDFELNKELALRLAVGLAGAGALWWAYFDRLHQVWEHVLRTSDEDEIGVVARDVYSLGHYPMIVGIVFYAVALEEAFLHPDEPMKGIVASLYVVSLGLFLLATVAVTLRTNGRLMYERVIGIVVIAAIAALAGLDAEHAVLASTVVLVVSLAVEYWRFRDMIREFDVTH